MERWQERDPSSFKLAAHMPNCYMFPLVTLVKKVGDVTMLCVLYGSVILKVPVLFRCDSWKMVGEFNTFHYPLQCFIYTCISMSSKIGN